MTFEFSAVLFVLCIVTPALIYHGGPPSLSAYPQFIALITWGVCVSMLPKRTAPKIPISSSYNCFILAAALIAVCAQASVFHKLPVGISLIYTAYFCAAVLTFITGYSLPSMDVSLLRLAFLYAMMLAGLISAAIGYLQIFAPSLCGNFWIAPPWGQHRIGANLRQPNLLATQLLWALAALVPLYELSRLNRAQLIIGALAMSGLLPATGSRMGMACIGGLSLWGIFDQRLRRTSRLVLFALPLSTLLSWFMLDTFSDALGTTPLRDVSMHSSRYVLWQQTLSIIAAHPWFGIGLGEFNFIWTLTPFVRDNPSTFTHTHNLLLQWAVELGLPATILLTGFFGYSYFKCASHAFDRRMSTSITIVPRFCVVMIAIVLFHSMLEYPLWYAYFLLPTAFAWGIASGSTACATSPRTTMKWLPKVPAVWLSYGGLLMVCLSVFAIHDYQRVSAIYDPETPDRPRAATIADARKSLLFGHLADRFAGTLAPKGTRTLEPYKRATHEMLDMRLLISWALSLQENGEIDKARYLAQRVKDFNDPVSHQFFAACNVPLTPNTKLPWQCTPPTRTYTAEDFL